MTRIYFLSFPVVGKQVARTLGSASTWDVLEELRKTGLDGLTADEISKKLDLPKATVYATLSKLQAAEWVEPRRARKKLGRPDEKTEEEFRRTGKTKQIYVEKIPWWEAVLDEEFELVVSDAIEKTLEDHQFVESFADAMEKILSNLEKDKQSKEFLPSSELCPKCKTSHEANEFVWAVGMKLIQELLNDEKLKPVYKKHNIQVFEA